MASASAKTMVRAVMMAAVLLQCCGVLLAARPLKGDVVAGGGGGGGEMFVMQILKTSTPTTPVGNGVVVVAVLLMQCCNAIMAARLLEGDLFGSSWLQGQGGVAAGELILQVLKEVSSGPPGNDCHQGGAGSGGHCYQPPKVVVVAVLLMQCCNAIMAARLLEGDSFGSSWLQGQGGVAGELILQVLDNGGSPPGGNDCHQGPNPGGSGSGKCWTPVVLVAVLLMQCCNAIMAARLLEGDLGSWLQGQGGVAGELILQVLKGGSPPGGNGCHQGPGGGSGASCHQPVVLVAVLLMQCCNAIMAARLLEGDLGSWLQSQGGVAGELILQVLDKGVPSPPGNGCHQGPGGGSGATCNPP
uniref:Uncharacterized protein n=1 Tax=Oryza meridionalis TaxID=40149 RepID=A0A0E0CVM1_9ORYZ